MPSSLQARVRPLKDATDCNADTAHWSLSISEFLVRRAEIARPRGVIDRRWPISMCKRNPVLLVRLTFEQTTLIENTRVAGLSRRIAHVLEEIWCSS
jgi:hypothetical protein